MYGSGRRRGLIGCVGVVLSAVCTLGVASDDEPEEPAPGVLVTFAASIDAKPLAPRVVADLTGDWGDGAPDPRVPADGFVARWSGFVLIQAPGDYRFFPRTDGAILVRVAGDALAPGAAVALKPGFRPIALEYRHQRGEAFAALDWEGPSFAREPVPARLLFHDQQAERPVDRFEAGRRAADRYGCANCHALLDLSPRRHLGPALADAARTLDSKWLVAWLSDPTRVRPGTRMPAFGHGFTPQEAADLAALLDRVAARNASAPTSEIKMALNVASANKGRLLFRSLGCLGCHPSTANGGNEASAAPDLADVGWKRSQAGLAVYLVHPKNGTSRHRADFRLTADEAAHIAAYLGSPSHAQRGRDGARGAATFDAADAPAGDAARGRAIAERARCASCHDIPGLAPAPPVVPLKAGARTDAGCLANEPPAWVPRFVFADETRADLAALVAGLPRMPSSTGRATRGEDAVRRRHCLGCHTRDGQGGTGLGAQLAALLGDDSELAGKKGTLTPPNLTGVGDKLRPEYLSDAIHGAAPTARPWLSVRMPVFAFEPGEAEAIATLFQSHDRMRREPEPPAITTRPDPATRETAARLIGQRGFGCVSCHVLAGRIPPGGEPETLGPDLALAHRRMTERYFRRWIANPQRIIAGTPMPQFLQPVATVPGTLEDQLNALWQLLGSTHVNEVAAFGTREFLKREGDRALVVRDMVLLPDAPGTPYTPRALALGLKNDHTLLFDTDRLTWLAWWRGGFLSRTKSGRLWEWHPEGERLWTAPNRLAPVAFRDQHGALVGPVAVRERFGSFRELDFAGGGLSLRYALNLPGGGTAEVVEDVQPTADGWERAVRVSGLPAGLRPVLIETPPAAANGNETANMTWSAGRARVTLEIVDATPIDSPAAGTRAFLMTAHAETFVGRVRLKARDRP